MATHDGRNPERADRVIQFIERLAVPSGVGAGQPFVLCDFQKKFIRDIYEPCDGDGLRTVQRAVLSIARKNGKTALIAAIVLAHLIGPEAVRNAEIYSAANDKEQAAVVYKFLSQIVRMNTTLSKYIDLKDSLKTAVCARFGTVYRALSREATTKHGLNPALFIYDELSQAKNEALWEALDTAQGAQREPLGVVISTQSPDPDHIMSRLVDFGLDPEVETAITHLYAVPDDAKDVFTDKSLWALANPALGSFRSLKDIENQAEKAVKTAGFENSFRNLYLNQRVSTSAPLISQSAWLGAVGEYTIADGEAIYVGLDLSVTGDLTGLVAVTEELPARVLCNLWMTDHNLQDKITRGRAPFDVWMARGDLQRISGKVIDYDVIANCLHDLSRRYTIRAVAYDRWKMSEFVKVCNGLSIPVEQNASPEKVWPGTIPLVPFGQGYRDMTPAIDELERMICSDQLLHSNNAALNYCMLNAFPLVDPAGNRKLSKINQYTKIDGAVALVMACGIRARVKSALAGLDGFLARPIGVE